MPPQVVRVGPSHVDVLDRVLDKGIVIDAWLRVSLVGIELVTVDARVVVASIATYLELSDPLAAPPKHAPLPGAPPLPARPRPTPPPTRRGPRTRPAAAPPP